MPIFVSLDFKKYTDDKLVTFTNTVYQHMSVDAQYASLKPSIDDIKIKFDAFTTGISLAVRRDKDRIDEKNAFKEALLQHLSIKIARKLEDLAIENGDNPRIITDAGFEVRGANKTAKEAVTILDTPVLTVKNVENKSGYATVKCKRVRNAINYAFLHRKMGEPVWQNGNYNNSGEFTFTNLEPKTVYEFQIYAQGPDGLSSDMSMPVAIYVS